LVFYSCICFHNVNILHAEDYEEESEPEEDEQKEKEEKETTKPAENIVEESAKIGAPSAQVLVLDEILKEVEYSFLVSRFSFSFHFNIVSSSHRLISI
jgi:hypothetical protein